MRIGFAKMGRSWQPNVAKASTVGGDIDVVRSFERLLRDVPESTIVSVGKTQDDPRKYYNASRVESPWHADPRWGAAFGNPDVELPLMREWVREADLDALVIWAGQMCTSSKPVPTLKSLEGKEPPKLTSPYLMCRNYMGYLVELINTWRELRPDRDVIWLIPDPRNYLKIRDLALAPTHPLLAQYQMVKHQYAHWSPERGLYRADHHYVYAAVEHFAIADEVNWPDAKPLTRREHALGVVSNENARGRLGRATLIRQWCGDTVAGDMNALPLFGNWTDEGLAELGRTLAVTPVPYTSMYDTVGNFMATVTFPASGSGWATAKPWEAFACGTICFFHPQYDTQGHIVATSVERAGSDAERVLARWLRVTTPAQLHERLRALATGQYAEVAEAQRQHLLDRFSATSGGTRDVVTRLYDPTTVRKPKPIAKGRSAAKTATVSQSAAAKAAAPKSTADELRNAAALRAAAAYRAATREDSTEEAQ